jgi:hypothetical protein
MHSKSHKIYTLKIFGCYLAQRVNGSKVEAKESTKNSKALNWMSWKQVYSVGWSDAPVLTRVRWDLQPTDSKWTVGWTDGTRISSSDALGFGYSSGQGSALKHRTIRRLDHRFIPQLHLNSTETCQDFCFSTGWTDAWIEDTISSSNALIQIIQYRPKCGVFSTWWSDGASVYSVGALSGFLDSTAILESVSDRMIRRSAGGHHRIIRRYNFFRGLFQWLAFFARPINKPPCLFRAVFATLKIYCSLGEKESVFLPIGISLPLHWGVLS